ncbi:sulfotransferase domain-containing protein, partial [Chloroflexota bacterium]
LTQVLEGFTGLGPVVNSGLPAVVTFDGVNGRRRTEDEILKDLNRLLPGDIAYGHLHANPEITEFVCRQGTAPYFILRDPRDVVLSHSHYITEMETNHVYHHYYSEVLQNENERIEASIKGISKEIFQDRQNTSINSELPDILARFSPYIGWLNQPEVLVLHFEDFITNQQTSIVQVLDHAVKRGFIPTFSNEVSIQNLVESIDPRQSPTFRSGKIGGWHTAFNAKNKELFKHVTGDLLIQLGYEKDYLW